MVLEDGLWKTKFSLLFSTSSSTANVQNEDSCITSKVSVWKGVNCDNDLLIKHVLLQLKSRTSWLALDFLFLTLTKKRKKVKEYLMESQPTGCLNFGSNITFLSNKTLLTVQKLATRSIYRKKKHKHLVKNQPQQGEK